MLKIEIKLKKQEKSSNNFIIGQKRFFKGNNMLALLTCHVVVLYISLITAQGPSI